MKNINDIDVTVISNCTIKQYKSVLNGAFENEVVGIVDLNEIYNQMSTLRNSKMIVVFLCFEYLFPDYYISLFHSKEQADSFFDEACTFCLNIYEFLKKETTCPILWFGFDSFDRKLVHINGFNCLGTIDNINYKLRVSLNVEDTYVDFNHIISYVGVLNAYDEKNEYRWGAMYSIQTIRSIALELRKQYDAFYMKSPKCIILDCDNVLWSGIIAEDGIEGIAIGSLGIGRKFQDFQRFLLSLYYQGIILAICSKNDIHDIESVFNNHSGMILKKQHFAKIIANWNRKSTNIKEIIDYLNISPRDVVFVDDMINEINEVKSEISNIKTILFHEEDIYTPFDCFNLKPFYKTDIIQQRNLTYATNTIRNRINAQCETDEEYSKKLETKVIIRKALLHECYRISELSLRTNKCTNGRRMSVSEVRDLIKNSEYSLYCVYLSDRYSDFGLVGAIGILQNKLDLFALSCRALGRNVEKLMFDKITMHSIDNVVVYRTGKNDEILKYLSQLF